MKECVIIECKKYEAEKKESMLQAQVTPQVTQLQEEVAQWKESKHKLRTKGTGSISELEAQVDEAREKATMLKKEPHYLKQEVSDLGEIIDAKDAAQLCL